jgi:hypothetical protein
MSYVNVWVGDRWDMRVASASQRMHLLLNPEIKVKRANWRTAPRHIKAAWLAVRAMIQVYQYAVEEC